MNRSLVHLSDEATEVIVSLNPKAGARSSRPLVEQLVELLRQAGMSVRLTSDIAEVSALSEDLQRQGRLRAVVAAGGDGTVSLIANRTLPGTPIAVFPLGTENLLSKYLGVTAVPQAVAELIASGATVRLDAGLAGDRLFLLMAGCGLDAEVVRQLHDARTGHIHHLSYAKPIFNSLRSYRYPELRIYCRTLNSEQGGGEASCDPPPIRARWAFAVNLPRYAGGLNLAPGANGLDGLLNVCTFKEGSLWNGLRYLCGVAFKQHGSFNDCIMQQATHVRIEADEPAPYQLDGDPGGYLPLELQVLPERLTMIVPQAWATSQGLATFDSTISSE